MEKGRYVEESCETADDKPETKVAPPLTPLEKKPVFTPRWDEKRQAVIHTIDESMPVLERKHVSRFLHEEVQQSRLLTDQEKSDTKLLQVPPNTVQYHNIPGMDVPAVGSVNAEWLFQHGHLDKFLAIRKQMLHKDFQPTIAKVCKKKEAKYVERAGTTYQFGMTFQPHYGASSCQLGTLSRQEEQSHVRDPFLGLINAVSDVVKDFLPELKGNGRYQNQLANASLLPGKENNGNSTSMQVNFSELAKGLTGIKKFGALHPDGNDYWTTLTSMVIFSNTPDNIFGGFLNITPLNVVVPLAPLMIVFFPANLFHVSTGQGVYLVAEGSPLRVDPPTPGLIPELLPQEDYPHTRLTIPLYADRRLMKPRFSQFNPEIYSWEGRNGLGGKALYPTRDLHVKWMMNFYIVKEPEIRGRLVRNALRILMQNKRRAAANVNESIWAGRIPSVRFDEGCGPDLLRKAFDTCARLGAESLESRIPRNGDPDHYVSLFAYDEDGVKKYPSRQYAIDVLEAIDQPNPEFVEMEKELHKLNCGNRWNEEEKGAVIWIPKQNKEETDECTSREEFETQEMELH